MKSPIVREVSERGLIWIGILEGGFLLRAKELPGGPRVISAGLAYYSPGHLVAKSHKLAGRMQAVDLLRKHLEPYCGVVHAYTKVMLQTQFDALVSFTYSIGVQPFIESPVMYRIRTNASPNSIAGAMGYYADAMTLHGEREPDPKLKDRRRCEAFLFLNGIYKTP